MSSYLRLVPVLGGLLLIACGANDAGDDVEAEAPIVAAGTSADGGAAPAEPGADRADGGAPAAPVAPSTFTVFHTALVAECAPSAGSACADVNQDGLADAWEDAVLAKFRPMIEFDEQEKGFTDPSFHMGMAGRVVPRAEDPTRIVVFFGFLYSQDYGSCSFTDHHGDIERAVIELERVSGTPGDVRWVKAFTAAHEGDITDASHTASDEGAIEKDLESIANADGSPRWLVYSSRNKHGTYISKSSCESKKIPCLADYCGGGSDRAKYQRVLDVLNAGEPDHPRDSNWAKFGYPTTDAWSKDKFCGVATSGDCDEPPRFTFVHDPYTKKDL